MSDSDRAGEDREIDRLQKELLAFVVDQLTAQADSSGLVTLPPKLMAAIDAHTEASLATRVAGTTLPDAEAFSQSVLSRVACEGRGLAERIAALENRIDAMIAGSQQQGTGIGGIANDVQLAAPTSAASGAKAPAKKASLGLFALIAGAIALIAAIGYFGGTLIVEAFNSQSESESPATDPAANGIVPPAADGAEPGLEADPVVEPAATSASPPPAATQPRPSARPQASASPKTNPQPPPRAAAPQPAAIAPAGNVTGDLTVTDAPGQNP